MSSKLQPLSKWQDITLTNRERNQQLRAISQWQPEQLNINTLTLNQAIINVHFNGYNYDRIIQMLALQTSLAPASLHLILTKKQITDPSWSNPDELNIALENGYYQPDQATRNAFADLWMASAGLKACPFSDLINAINQQLINSHGTTIHLTIDNNQHTQKEWQSLRDNTVRIGNDQADLGNARLIKN